MEDGDDVHALVSGPGRGFSAPRRILSPRILAEEGRRETPPRPATCVLIFRVECCCLLALQERERVGKTKQKILWRCVSFVCALFFSDVRPIYDLKKKEEKAVVGNGNLPCVNKEKLELSLFSCYDRRLGRCPAPFFCFLVSFPSLFSFSLFPRGGKGG